MNFRIGIFLLALTYSHFSYALELKWSFTGAIPGMSCTHVWEHADPHDWGDNFLCSDKNIGLQFSQSGQIPNKECISLDEPLDPHTWADNYLCWNRDRQYKLRFSISGPINGMSCLPMNEPSDPDSWTDNFICVARPVCEMATTAEFPEGSPLWHLTWLPRNKHFMHAESSIEDFSEHSWFSSYYSASQNRFVPSYRKGLWNDSISSVRVAPGCTLTLYEHAHFEGASRSYIGGQNGKAFSLVDEFDDVASSANCTCAPNHAFRGRMEPIIFDLEPDSLVSHQ